MVESRWATTIVVRLEEALSSAFCTKRSDWVSKAEVAYINK